MLYIYYSRDNNILYLILIIVKDTTNKFKTIEKVKNGNKR